MWKLIIAECRYHWFTISVAYAIILFLAFSYVHFEGANWHIVSTASSLVLILASSRVGTLINNEKRFRRTLPVPVEFRQLCMARIVFHALFVAVGLTILWFTTFPFAPSGLSLSEGGRIVVLFGFIFLNISVFTLLTDLKAVLTSRLGSILYNLALLLSVILLMAAMASVYLFYYSSIREIFGVDVLHDYFTNSPGVFIFATLLFVVGAVLATLDVLVFNHRKTFLE